MIICNCKDSYDCYIEHDVTCKHCGKVTVKSHHWITQMGEFCSVNCAQKDYEDQWLEDELSSDDPHIFENGLGDALARTI